LSPEVTIDFCRKQLVTLNKALDVTLKPFLKDCENTNTEIGTVFTLEDFYFFKLVIMSFPITDFRHIICTPSQIYLAKVLSNSKIQSEEHFLSKLIIVSLLFDFISEVKRFIPEVFETFVELYKYLANIVQKEDMSDSADMLSPLMKLYSKRQFPGEMDWFISIPEALLYQRILNELILKYAELYKDDSTFDVLFEPLVKVFDDFAEQEISNKKFVTRMKEVAEAYHKIARTVEKRQSVEFATFKPVPIKSLEPLLDEKFVIGVQKRTEESEADRIKKLKKKLRDNQKGAERELRKDTAAIQAEIARDDDEKVRIVRNCVSQDLSDSTLLFFSLISSVKIQKPSASDLINSLNKESLNIGR